ncbi:DUF6286 domain-containing protein [Kineococcus rhizosphaerae]|nr:DUF6286 domain-containing protein [Kineococcus rhizosphaerae]
MPAASQRTGTGHIGWIGPVLAVLLLALAAVLIHEALLAAGAFASTSWLAWTVQSLRGFAPTAWLIPVGIVLALIGVWLLVTALRPRTRNTLPLTSRTGVFLHTRDVARLASGAARDVDGVLSAASTSTRRAISVTITATGDSTGQMTHQVQAAVARAVGALASPPRVKVRTRTTGTSTGSSSDTAADTGAGTTLGGEHR